MGNRAVIELSTDAKAERRSQSDPNLGIYLHWNGGRDSVQAFLMYCKLQGYPSPERDLSGWGHLFSICHSTLGSSVYLVNPETADRDNYDNGVYEIKNWEIVGRLYHDGPEQNEYDLAEFLLEIDKNLAPELTKLGEDKIRQAVADHTAKDSTAGQFFLRHPETPAKDSGGQV